MPYVTSGHSKLYYERCGEGAPVVLAHGVGGNHASWFNQVPSFAQHYTTITIDHRAFGNSEDVEGIGQAGYLDDLLRLLDALQLETVSLIGQSMGGATCAAFACRYPGRVRALVHADSLAGVTLSEPHATTLASTNARTRELSQLERVLGPGICREDPEHAFLYLQIASFNSVTLKSVKGRAPLWSPRELAHTGIPVLFVAGEQDVICPPALIAVMHRDVPGSRLQVIPGAGHSAYFEAPRAFNQHVLKFLAEVHA
jgi:pimeloyl-ACP methyl ester carboxylesterase